MQVIAKAITDALEYSNDQFVARELRNLLKVVSTLPVRCQDESVEIKVFGEEPPPSRATVVRALESVTRVSYYSPEKGDQVYSYMKDTYPKTTVVIVGNNTVFLRVSSTEIYLYIPTAKGLSETSYKILVKKVDKKGMEAILRKQEELGIVGMHKNVTRADKDGNITFYVE